MADGKMTEDELKALVASEISSSLTYDTSELSQRRVKALEYYQGEMPDLPPMEGRSSATSRDLADTIGWMLPGIMRVFTASDQMAVFEPETQEDEAFAQQATDYCNFVFWRDNDGYRTLYNITHDSLLHGNGVGKIWWDDSEDVETSEHTGLTEMHLAELMADEDVEILAAEEAEDVETVEQVDPETGQPVIMPIVTYDVKIKRIKRRGKICIDSIPPEDFLMDKDAITLGEARFTAHREAKTRSELIEMGFDRDTVEDLPSDGLQDWKEESIARDEDRVDFEGNVQRAEEQVELYECYLRADADDDGVSETLKIYYAGRAGSGKILEWEICEDGNPFFDCPCEPVPHRWDARSIADDTMDVQKIKTALFRQMLDNIYASNLPMVDVDVESVLNPEALANPQFGQIIWRKQGSRPINWQEVPFVAGESLTAIEFFDSVIEKRTGVSRTTMALDPEALQNQTATANQNAKDAAYSQIELIARNHAEMGWRDMFKKMLALLVKHQDRPRTIRLRDEWVDMDPRHWNAGMDVTINVGLGTGSRDRDMTMLAAVQQNQKALVDYAAEAGEAELAIEMLPKVLHSMRKMAESAGIKDVDAFYPDVSPDDVAALKQRLAAKQGQPSPEMAQEQAKLQMEAEKIKIQSDLKREEMNREFALREQQMVMEMDLKIRQLNAEMELKREMALMGLQTGTATSPVRMGGAPG